MKYKVGDRVRVRSDLKETDDYRVYGIGTNSEMVRMAGKVVTISHVGSSSYKIEGYGYFWTDKMFEGYVGKPRKEELFNMPMGTIVKTDREEHNVYVKVGENDFCNDNLDHIKDNNVYNNLTIERFEKHMKILEIQKPTYETIYKADKQPKKMTQKEIEKKLGYPIEIIEEK